MNRTLILVLLLALVVRLALWSWFSQCHTLHDDEKDYNQLAKALVERGEYAFYPGKPISLRPPLYPAAVACIYSIAGSENLQAVRLFQIGLSLLTAFLVFELGKELYSREVGVAAAAFYSFYPSLLIYNNLVLTETQFTLLLVAFCVAAVKGLNKQSLAWIMLAGVLLGLAALTRSVLWMFPPVLALFLLVVWPAKVPQRLVAAGLLVMAFACVVAPWAVRNTRLQRTFTAVDCMGGRNFMMGNYEHTPVFRSWAAIGIQGEQAWNSYVYRANPGPSGGWSQGQLDKLAAKEGMKFVLAHPGLTLQRDIVKFFDFWGLERETVSGALQGYYGRIPAWGVAMFACAVLGAYIALLFSGVFGAATLPPQKVTAHWLLLLVILYTCGIHSVVFGHSRYHVPLIPIIVVYAAALCVDWRLVWSQRTTLRFHAATAVCLILLAGWGTLFVLQDADRLQHLLQAASL